MTTKISMKLVSALLAIVMLLASFAACAETSCGDADTTEMQRPKHRL